MNNNIEKYELTDKQIAACKDIEKAFKKAIRLGITFLGKSELICAYRTEALNKAVSRESYHDHGKPIPEYTMRGCIKDSGADDEEYFPTGFITD